MMKGLRIGSLFSGAGGLDLAVEQATGGTTVWHSENDKHAAAVLAAHWPGVPNHGDISAVDWRSVEPVDVMCGGFPCQDVATVGNKAGMTANSRSGLWQHYCWAILVLRPRAVVIENVLGLLSTKGDDGRRGIDRVCSDLSTLGYGSRRVILSAAHIGAPHLRRRVFIVARRPMYSMPAMHSIVETPPCEYTDPRLPSPFARDGKGRSVRAAVRTDGRIRTSADRLLPDVVLDGDLPKYTVVLDRWSTVTRAVPPAAVEPGKYGQDRLAPAFSEWMMGWPSKWVTGVVDPHSHRHRIIGNGVVVPQARAALELLDFG